MAFWDTIAKLTGTHVGAAGTPDYGISEFLWGSDNPNLGVKQVYAADTPANTQNLTTADINAAQTYALPNTNNITYNTTSGTDTGGTSTTSTPTPTTSDNSGGTQTYSFNPDDYRSKINSELDAITGLAQTGYNEQSAALGDIYNTQATRLAESEQEQLGKIDTYKTEAVTM